MKTFAYILAVGFAFLESAIAENNTTKEQLSKIEDSKSSTLSKNFVTAFDISSDVGFSNVVKRAIETENEDLLELIRRKIEAEDWTKARTWEEGLAMTSRMIEGLELVAKRFPSMKSKLKSYFLSAPDVPYEKVTDWHRGYGYRGLQGSILKIIAENDAGSFEEIVSLLDKDSISISKKKTIVWAMRYDKSGFSEKKLKEEIPTPNESLKKEFEDSLKYSINK